ncbi:MAG: hypothetical protein NZ990_06210 [Myxococcota bacterium]|nr:hypothetical protein [Myxococcota bacterium]
MAPTVGWILVILLIAYTAMIHHGLGGTERGGITSPWQPTGFLRETEWAETLVEHWGLGIVVFASPALIAMLVVGAATRSAMARCIAVCSVASVALMAFYGLSPALRVWEFFHWRASLVILATGIALGCTLSAPLLVERWLRVSPVWQAVLYLPIFFAVASIIRNATGSDDSLFLNFSPWPAISVIGLEIGAYALCGLLFGLALGLAGAGLTRERRWLRWIGFAPGLVFPLLWFRTRFGGSSFEIDGWLLVVSALSLFLVSRTRSPAPASEYFRRAFLLFLGAFLAAAPLFTGRALADGDYALTRHVRAQAIIDALADYYENEEAYPESLARLVEENYIDALPRPRIGFAIYYAAGLLERPEFEYRNLGPSYVLEFSATAWVMCSYNPPWHLDEDEDPEEFDDPEALMGAWSCPDDRPDLW